MVRFVARCFVLTVVITFSGCAPLLEPSEKPAPDVTAFASNPLPPEKAKEALEEVGKGFVYGPGVGEAVVNGGAAILFPPYAVVLIGNAVLSLSGYEPVTVSRMLPEEAGKAWGSAYDEVVSGPGRVNAALAGEEFRNREMLDATLLKLMEKPADQAAAPAPLPVGDTQ